ncbi:MAG: hypothetical protein J0I49_01465, partial [Pseudonocardia sp.]|nr:hypothetical protein [Pseudonocardia sp.]
ILAAPGSSNSAALLLAFNLGGELLLGIVAAVAFATILAVVSGLTIVASASVAHDLYANVVTRGTAEPATEIRVARRTAVVVGVVATGGGILANGQNVAVLVTLAFAVAASTNMAPLLFSLFWRRFNTAGALWSMYGGMTTASVLVIFSPAVSGAPSAMLPDIDFAWFPLANPGLVSVPVSFLLGVLGTFLGRPEPDADRRFAEMEVRALTGARAVDDATSPVALAPAHPAPTVFTPTYGKHAAPHVR